MLVYWRVIGRDSNHRDSLEDFRLQPLLLWLAVQSLANHDVPKKNAHVDPNSWKLPYHTFGLWLLQYITCFYPMAYSHSISPILYATRGRSCHIMPSVRLQWSHLQGRLFFAGNHLFSDLQETDHLGRCPGKDLTPEAILGWVDQAITIFTQIYPLVI